MNPKELKKPNVSEELATELVLRFYGLKVTAIKRMVSYDDQNFHIKVSSDYKNPYIKSISSEGYTLKVTNTEKSAQPGHFDTMHEAMTHFSAKGLKVPVPVPNINGTTWKLEKVPLLNEGPGDAEELCGIHMLTFVAGQPVSTVTYTRSVLYQWGSLLARFHNAAEDLSSPHLKTKDIFWNLGHVLEIRNFMEGLDMEKKDLVNSVLDQYPEKIEKHLSSLKKGVIHGDFNENNILLRVRDPPSPSGDEPNYVVEGVLDFEDLHYATYAWDIGCMLAYSLLDCKTMDPLEGAGHALAGYLAIRSLDVLDLSLLKMCTALRLCQSLVLGAYSYRLDPSNAYLLISARTGWNRLGQIWNTNDQDLLGKWEEIRKTCNDQGGFQNNAFG